MYTERLNERQLKDDPEIQLKSFKKTKEFFVAIDTDGCVTDNMNGKQMLIFHPQYMEFYNLWEIESYFREVAEYYNLFSVDRGCNRFVAISLILKALDERQEVKAMATSKKVVLPDFKMIDEFISFTKNNNLGLGNPGLEKYIEKNPSCYSLYKLLGWSEAVNRTFPYISAKIPPFDNMENILENVSKYADIIVVSKTPYIDLVNYWENYGIAKFVKVIAGQEMGSKGHHIEVVKKIGYYKNDNILMIGDGNGDLKAVKANNGLFYPINPGSEQGDWDNFNYAFEKFINKEYKGDFEEDLLLRFKNSLLTNPQWLQTGYNHANNYRQKQSIRRNLYEKFNPSGRLCVF